jgi:hypothetical protein
VILRRLAQHLKDQNWTAISIEFVLLVLGVFLGIQVANWNEARADRQRGASFSAKLVDDVRAEAWRYQFLLAYHQDVRDFAQQALADLERSAPLPDQALLVAAYRASQYKQGAARRATYDELVSTGTLGLVGDPALRRLADRLYSISTIDNLIKEGLESPFRRWMRMNLPLAAQRALSMACGDRYIAPGDYREFDRVIDYPCTPDLAPPEVAAAANLLRTDPAVVQYLRLRIADLDTRLNDMTQNNRDIVEGLQAYAGTRE